MQNGKYEAEEEGKGKETPRYQIEGSGRRQRGGDIICRAVLGFAKFVWSCRQVVLVTCCSSCRIRQKRHASARHEAEGLRR